MSIIKRRRRERRRRRRNEKMWAFDSGSKRRKEERYGFDHYVQRLCRAIDRYCRPYETAQLIEVQSTSLK